MITITPELLEQGINSKGSWSDAQIRALGEDKSLSGWKQRLLDNLVSPEQIEVFLRLKDKHIRKPIEQPCFEGMLYSAE